MNKEIINEIDRFWNEFIVNSRKIGDDYLFDQKFEISKVTKDYIEYTEKEIENCKSKIKIINEHKDYDDMRYMHFLFNRVGILSNHLKEIYKGYAVKLNELL